MTRVLKLTHSADASSQNPRGIEPKRSGPPLHEHTGSVGQCGVCDCEGHALGVGRQRLSADVTPHSAPYTKTLDLDMRQLRD